jgi:hypothetical protein
LIGAAPRLGSGARSIATEELRCDEISNKTLHICRLSVISSHGPLAAATKPAAPKSVVENRRSASVEKIEKMRKSNKMTEAAKTNDDDKRFETAKLYYQYVRSKQKRADELAIAHEKRREEAEE